MATGSGFVIDTEGHLLTNNHVVEGATSIEVKLGSSEKSYSAKVVGTDPATDVALLKVDVPADQLHPLALGDSSQLEVGDPVVAIGNPFGLDRTVTSGIVSALQRQIEAPNGFSISHVIQTDAAINPGNSGGPLIDAEGRVVGINSQIETGGGNGNVGIGFAIPIDTAREVAKQIEEQRQGRARLPRHQRRHDHARPGEGAQPAGRRRRARRRKSSRAAPPTRPASKAATPQRRSKARASRLGGDIITEIDGKKIDGDGRTGRSDRQRHRSRATRSNVTVLRGGQRKDASVR